MESRQMNVDLMNAVSAVVAAQLASKPIPEDQIPDLIRSVALALQGVAAGEVSALAAQEHKIPAVPIERSIQDEFLVCLEDGKKLKMLGKHLRKLGLTPEQYRAKWGLPPDYPMVAPAYSRTRAQIARRTGFQPLQPQSTH